MKENTEVEVEIEIPQGTKAAVEAQIRMSEGEQMSKSKGNEQASKGADLIPI